MLPIIFTHGIIISVSRLVLYSGADWCTDTEVCDESVIFGMIMCHSIKQFLI